MHVHIELKELNLLIAATESALQISQKEKVMLLLNSSNFKRLTTTFNAQKDALMLLN